MKARLRRWGGAVAIGLAATIALAGGTGPSRAAKPAPVAAAEPAASAFVIDGFRSARFGMTEAEVRAAIRKDFPAEARDVHSAVNSAEKTAALSLSVTNLLPDSGPASVGYVFGYKSHRLIQINVLWSSAAKDATPQGVVATGNMLRDYFIGQGAPAAGRIVNATLPDGTIVILRASDPHGRMVLIVLSGANPKQKPSAGHSPPPLVLGLSYILDPANPDIFRLKKGAF
jgi:hypothetical protein